jgi:murein L,D-transpeptidase YcbB/YkuD
MLLTVAVTIGVGAVAVTPANAAYVRTCTYTQSQPTESYDPTHIKTAVKQIQCELNYSLYYTKVDIDGSFGPATLAAVRRFQDCTKTLKVDGVVGPLTWGALNAWAESSLWADKPC